MSPERRARALLVLGAATGLAASAISLLRGGVAPRPRLPADAVAVVNGIPIRRDDYLRALGGVVGDRRMPLDEAERRRVLDRLVDEELLVQRGLDLGLARRDHAVRGPLVAATIDVLASGGGDPSNDELQRFYEQARDYFVEPGRVRVRQIVVRTEGRSEEDAHRRADEAIRRLREGEDFATVQRELGDDEGAPIPATLLPPAKLREYVGETATRAALELPGVGLAGPIRSSAGFHVLEVVERTPAFVPPFDEIVDRVRAEHRRRADEARLRSALDELRRGARLETTERLP